MRTALARREGAMVMVHAENHDVIRWMSERLLAKGHGAPKYHAISHARPDGSRRDVTIYPSRPDRR